MNIQHPPLPTPVTGPPLHRAAHTPPGSLVLGGWAISSLYCPAGPGGPGVLPRQLVLWLPGKLDRQSWPRDGLRLSQGHSARPSWCRGSFCPLTRSTLCPLGHTPQNRAPRLSPAPGRRLNSELPATWTTRPWWPSFSDLSPPRL